MSPTENETYLDKIQMSEKKLFTIPTPKSNSVSTKEDW